MSPVDNGMYDGLLPPDHGVGEEKSLFSVLKPAPHSSHTPPPPAPPPPAPPPPAPPSLVQQELADSVQALSRKMEEFQKKLSDIPPPSASVKNDSAQAELIAFLQARIGALEQKVIDAQQSALAAQLKLTEREGVERRIRAETEEVLKTARENGRAIELQRLLSDRITKLEHGRTELEERLISLAEEVEGRVKQARAVDTARANGEFLSVLSEVKALKEKMASIEAWRQKAGGWDKIFEEVAMLGSKLAVAQMAFSRVEEMEVKVKAMAGFDEILQVTLQRFSQVEGQLKVLSAAFGVAEARNQLGRDSFSGLQAGIADISARVGVVASSLKALSEEVGTLKLKQTQTDMLVAGQSENISALERQRKDVAENMNEHLKKIKDMVDRFGG